MSKGSSLSLYLLLLFLWRGGGGGMGGGGVNSHKTNCIGTVIGISELKLNNSQSRSCITRHRLE